MQSDEGAVKATRRSLTRHFVPFEVTSLALRAPRLRDSTASVDDLRFKRHDVPFNAPTVRFKGRAMQSDRVAVKATCRSSFSGKLRKRHSRAQSSGAAFNVLRTFNAPAVRFKL